MEVDPMGLLGSSPISLVSFTVFTLWFLHWVVFNGPDVRGYSFSQNIELMK